MPVSAPRQPTTRGERPAMARAARGRRRRPGDRRSAGAVGQLGRGCAGASRCARSRPGAAPPGPGRGRRRGPSRRVGSDRLSGPARARRRAPRRASAAAAVSVAGARRHRRIGGPLDAGRARPRRAGAATRELLGQEPAVGQQPVRVVPGDVVGDVRASCRSMQVELVEQHVVRRTAVGDRPPLGHDPRHREVRVEMPRAGSPAPSGGSGRRSDRPASPVGPRRRASDDRRRM